MATPITLETALRWAFSGRESDKVYRFLFLHPEDFFTIPKRKKWSIAHQVVYHGDVQLLRRILALFYDEMIDIRTLSKDNKTLLDVARERKNDSPDMNNYVEHLFLRDDLIQAAKRSEWPTIEEILKKDHTLANRKPPYSTFFLLHYIVQNGEQSILERFLNDYKIDTNIFSADLETPLDLARRLKKYDMCKKLEETTKEVTNSNLIKYRSSIPSEIKSTSLTLPYPLEDPFPSPIDLHNNLLTITQNGDYQLENKSFFPFVSFGFSVPIESIHSTTTPTITVDEMDNPDSATDIGPSLMTPTTPGTESQLLKNFKCPLTQEIFKDPVIARDGQTYEREAILEWLQIHPCSPITGAPMDATLVDNVELREIIKAMRKKE